MKTKDELRRDLARNLSGVRRGNACQKVKFSRAMWDRLLRDQNEYAALRKMPLGDA